MFPKLPVVLTDLLRQHFWQGRLDNPTPDSIACLCQLRDVLDIQVRQFLVNTFTEAIVIEKGPVGIGGGREPLGHRNTNRVELTDHLSERCVFAPYDRNRIHAEFGERDHLDVCQHDLTAPASMLYIRYMPNKSDPEERDEP